MDGEDMPSMQKHLLRRREFDALQAMRDGQGTPTDKDSMSSTVPSIELDYNADNIIVTWRMMRVIGKVDGDFPFKPYTLESVADYRAHEIGMAILKHIEAQTKEIP
jgi:hypothetical protein